MMNIINSLMNIIMMNKNLKTKLIIWYYLVLYYL